MKFRKGDYVVLKKHIQYNSKMKTHPVKVLGYNHMDKHIVVIERISKSGKARREYWHEQFFKRAVNGV